VLGIDETHYRYSAFVTKMESDNIESRIHAILTFKNQNSYQHPSICHTNADSVRENQFDFLESSIINCIYSVNYSFIAPKVTPVMK
jgi:hypothetical protein